MAKPLTAKLLREAAVYLRGFDEVDGSSNYFMCHAYTDAGGNSGDLMLLLGEAVGSSGWGALPMGLFYFEPAALAWRFDLFNILAEYLDAEQSELATSRGGS